METPGAAVPAVLVPAASGTRRKRAAGEAGAPTSRQRVLDEEEYIEVGLGVDASDFQATSLPRAPPPRAPPPRTPPPRTPPGSLPGYRRSSPLAKVEQPESLPSGCGQSGGQTGTVWNEVSLLLGSRRGGCVCTPWGVAGVRETRFY